MRFIDGFVEASFTETEDGDRLFLPWGALGRSYVLTHRGEEEVRKFLKIFYGVSLALILVGFLFLGSWAFAATGFILPWYAWTIHGILKLEKQSAKTVGLDETTRAQGRTMGVGGTVIILVLALCMLGLSTVVLLMSDDVHEARIGSGLGVVFFGGCTVLYVRQLVMLLKGRNQDK